MTWTGNPKKAHSVGGAGTPDAKTRIVVLGGGFGGVYTARHLEKLCARRPDVEIVLVSRDNYFLMYPLLFEVCSGVLEMRHCCVPIRAFLRTARFLEATVHSIDLDRRVIHMAALEGDAYELTYDQLVLALGSITNVEMIPGSEFAFTFKTLADAVVLRNHLIERFERADVETDAERKRKLLTIVVIGGGLVGVELFGELTAFVDEIIRYYRHVSRDEVQFVLLQAVDRIMPEIDSELAEYATRVLTARHGVELRTNSPVQAVEPGKVHLKAETIEAATIVLAAGTVPNPITAGLAMEKDKKGRIIVDATLRSKGRPELWALGDCAFVPDPNGKPYPALAQHALREAKVLAGNLHAALEGKPLEPFVYTSLGLMGSLGHSKGLAQVMKRFRLRGFAAWWVRRTYYLAQMPGWGRRLRIMIDWTFALLFRVDVAKVDMASERALLAHNVAAGAIFGVLPARLPESIWLIC